MTLHTNTDRIVLYNDTANDLHYFLCLHCGATSRYTLPMPLADWLRRCKGFVRRHRGCVAQGEKEQVS